LSLAGFLLLSFLLCFWDGRGVGEWKGRDGKRRREERGGGGDRDLGRRYD
jgi:hypothetical protein